MYFVTVPLSHNEWCSYESLWLTDWPIDQLINWLVEWLRQHESSRTRASSTAGLTHFWRSQLHWLDVVDWVQFRVCIQVFRCLHKMAPEYLSTYCQPVSGISGRHHLRSADRCHLDFPRVKLASYGGRSFAYAGPSNWNSLPAHLRDNSLSLSSFRRHLKTFLFSFY